MSHTRQLVDSAPVSRLQVRVLIICLLANMAEGYDLLSMSLAVVPLADEWGLTGTQTGVLLAMGPVGMALGAMLLAPLSDKFGRRLMLITSLAIVAVFTGASAFCGNMEQLMVVRLLAGIGMGGMLPILTITTGEFAPTHRRAAAIGLMGAGLPLGSAVGGAGAALLMSRTGWQSAFILGAVVTALVCLLVVMSVPETPDYLAAKDTPHARKKLAELLAKMGIDPQLAAVTPASDASGTHEIEAESDGTPLRSWQMVVVGFLFVGVVTTYYFSTMWLPKLLVLAGMSSDSGFSGVLLLTLGAAASGVLIAVLSTRYSLFVLLPTFAALSAVFLAVFSVVSSDLTLALVVAPVLGLFQSATGIGMYAFVPQLFGPSNRSAAMGLGIGLSRIAMIVMPLGIGILIDRSWSPESLFQLMIVPTLLTGVLVLVLWRDQRRRTARSIVVGAESAPASVEVR